MTPDEAKEAIDPDFPVECRFLMDQIIQEWESDKIALNEDLTLLTASYQNEAAKNDTLLGCISKLLVFVTSKNIFSRLFGGKKLASSIKRELSESGIDTVQ